jgi:hypothetical protein
MALQLPDPASSSPSLPSSLALAVGPPAAENELRSEPAAASEEDEAEHEQDEEQGRFSTRRWALQALRALFSAGFLDIGRLGSLSSCVPRQHLTCRVLSFLSYVDLASLSVSLSPLFLSRNRSSSPPFPLLLQVQAASGCLRRHSNMQR